MKILFMGTPDFAAENLKALINDGRDVAAIISQPNKPKNRGMQVVKTPTTVVGEENKIAVYHPETLKNEAIKPLLEEIDPDIIVVVAYGKILPSYVLDYPKYGCINIHASLLPKYRGAAPIQYSIIKGEKETGVTSMYMEKGLDTGDMILKESIGICDDDTAETLHDKLAKLGAKVLLKTLDAIKEGTAERVKQSDEDATYAAQLTKEMGNVNWEMSADEICCLIRGLYPWPGAYSYVSGKRFKIFSAEIENKNGMPGEIIDINDGILVACGEKSIRIREVQFESKKRMTVSDFLKGNSGTFNPGVKLGN